MSEIRTGKRKVNTYSPPRKLGGNWQGKVKISTDFDKLDKEISDSFYNSALFPNES